MGERKRSWVKPSALPTPEPRDGMKFRWIRTSLLGQSDNPNVSSRFREGYTPVKLEEHPELQIVTDIDSKFKDNVEVGGLMLCSIPVDISESRIDAQLDQAQNAIDAVDRNYMRENDPRMPVLNPERSTRTSFGR
jgi:hypothetical protein